MKLSIVLLAGLAAATCLRTRSAALRHWVLAIAVACAAALPILEAVAPAWPLNVAPARAADAGAPRPSVDLSVRARIDAAAAPEAAVPPARAIGWFAALWMLGTSLSLLTLAAGMARLAWLTSRARRASDRWLALTEQIRAEHHLRRRVHVLVSEHPSLLATWGVLRPRIIFPAAAAGWPDDLVTVILHHEIAHIRRCDWLTQMCGELLRAVYWFNPIAWLACRRLRAESEQACDDDVLRSGTEPSVYAEHLLTLARCFNRHRPWLPAPAMARPSMLHRRVAAMLNARTDRKPPALTARLVTLALLLTATLAIAAVQTATTLSGTVIDPQGGVLPGVRVTLTNADRQTTQEVETTRAGQFQFTGLAQGDYIVRVQLPGFQSYQATVSAMGTNVVQTIALQLGRVQESITVDDGAEPGGTPATSAAPPRAKPPCGEQPATGGVRIGGNIRPPIKIKDVRPQYPASLRGTGAAGEVVLDGVIGTDGFVHDIRARDGSQQAFVDAFIAAVTQWQFESTLLNCVAVEVPITMTGRFTPQR
jgi:beta-lactamase regulating signal transducer with metallopeptidase domain